MPVVDRDHGPLEVGVLSLRNRCDIILPSVPRSRTRFGTATKQYGFAGVGGSLAHTASRATRIDQVPAGLLLLGYAVVLVTAGTMAVRRRDVTS